MKHLRNKESDSTKESAYKSFLVSTYLNKLEIENIEKEILLEDLNTKPKKSKKTTKK